MNYTEISKSTMQALYKARMTLNDSPLSHELRVLLELRVSQINGCAYCCELHTAEAKQLNIADEKLIQLPGWVNAVVYSDEERAALHVAEALTLKPVSVQAYVEVLNTYFNEREIVDIGICIAMMNMFNRIAIAFHSPKA